MNEKIFVIFATTVSADGYTQPQFLWATNDESRIQAKYNELKGYGLDCYIDECDGWISSHSYSK